MIEMFDLNQDSFVVEVASNDGYLLKNFVDKKIPCLGIEPSKSTADEAINLGVETKIDFFSALLAKKVSKSHKKADLIVCNNVFAHVPDINDFTRGLSLLLSKDGVVTIEFQHLLTLIKYVQFDTIYHEHYSYLSVGTTKKILNKFGLRIFDVEKLKTHGGSVRIYACREDAKHITRDTVDFTIQEEKNARLFDVSSFKGFKKKPKKSKIVSLIS